jgi:hypothetical protein
MLENNEWITMDGEEAELIDRYEDQFGEVPPVAFLDPETSKKLITDALRNSRPFSESDLEPDLDFETMLRAANFVQATRTNGGIGKPIRHRNSKL